MKIGVTGASGHVGSNMVPALIRAGYEVRILGHTNFDHLSEFNVPLIKGDLLDKESMFEFVDGADTIIHLAAKIPMDKKNQDTLDVNINGTKNLVDVASNLKVSKFIFFSSIHSYNPFPLEKELDETRDLNFESEFDYDKSKAITEHYVLDSNRSGFNTIVLNPTAIIGPNDYKPSTLGRAIIQLYNGKIPALMNGGYNWVDVRDVVAGTLTAIKQAKPGNAYLLSGHWKSMFELADEVSKAGGQRAPGMIVPFWLAGIGAQILGIIPVRRNKEKLFNSTSLETLKNSPKYISNKKAAQDLNYKPRAFSDTIQDAVDWFRKNELI